MAQKSSALTSVSEVEMMMLEEDVNRKLIGLEWILVDVWSISYSHSRAIVDLETTISFQ